MFDSFFEVIGWENLVLISIFLISLAVLKFALKKTFDRGIANILAVVIALLITGGLYFAGIDPQGLLSDFGVGEDIITTVVPLIIFIGLAYLLWKFKSKFFFVAGIAAIIVALFGWAYQTGIMWFIGIACLLIGWWLWRRGRRGGGGEGDPGFLKRRYEKVKGKGKNFVSRARVQRDLKREVKRVKDAMGVLKNRLRDKGISEREKNSIQEEILRLERDLRQLQRDQKRTGYFLDAPRGY